MCGIVGVISQNINPNDIALTKHMMGAISHRGPDGEGMMSSQFVSFGHRRLSIIDLTDAASQPMSSHDGRYILTFNGEIYNYKELRLKLEEKGCIFTSSSDTEVLLQALITYKEKTMDHFIGMYAFAFHDKKTGQTLLARDEMGVKPLYYTVKNHKLYFASEIKALLLHPDIKREMNKKAQKQYLTFQFCLDDLTLYEGIYSLKPAYYIDIIPEQLNEEIEQKQYWDLNHETDFSITEDTCHEELSALLDDSLRLQLRSDVPVGAYLSGGIDSSFIAAKTSLQNGKHLKTFHGRFAEGKAYDESEYAKSVCDMYDAEYIETVPSAEDFVNFLPKIIYHMDEPSAGPGVFPQYCVSHSASKHLKVILGGQGGDEIFGGYARYVVAYLEQALKGAITGSNEEGRHIVNLASIAPNLSILKQYTPMLKGFWKDGVFDDMDARYFRLVDRSPNIQKILAFELFDDAAQKEIFEDFQSVFNRPDTESYINKMTNFDLHTLLPALLQVEDRVSMSASIESRVPLIDKRVIALMAKVPASVKFSNGKTKNVLRRIAEPILPASVMNREDKMGFPVPLSEWMKTGIVKEFVSDTLLSQGSRERGIFNPIELEKLIHAEAQFGRELWGALCLELWHQIFIDKTFKI